MGDLAEVQSQNIMPGFANQQSFELAQRAAKLLSQSTLVPKEYQGNLPNCVIALNMAARMGADPFMVMQNLYVIHGRPGWSSQFLIATCNTCGRFSAIRYEWVGKQGTDEWGCRAWATELATGEKIEGSTVTIGIAKKEGWYDRKDRDGKVASKWPTMPQQMLMYRAAAWFVRAYAPELAMGMHTEFEIMDTGDERTVDSEVVEREIKQNANQETIDIKPEAAEGAAAEAPQKAAEDAEPQDGADAKDTAEGLFKAGQPSGAKRVPF